MFELARIELPKVKLQWMYKANRLWFELARVQVIGSQLYLMKKNQEVQDILSFLM